MYITNFTETYSGFWPMTKENTYYGYKSGELYYWYKSKSTAQKHLKGTNQPYYRATKIKGIMYINRHYLTLTKW